MDDFGLIRVVSSQFKHSSDWVKVERFRYDFNFDWLRIESISKPELIRYKYDPDNTN